MFERLAAALADRYRIERELGAGGMATVYLAHDLKHNRKVALKILSPDLAATIGHERFLREITNTANLRHPHILPLFDSGEADTFLYYVMPFVEGETLRDRLIRHKQLPIDDALRIATEIAEALSYAHERGPVPKSYQAGGLYALRTGNETEPLGDRMMEISDDIERHELRDPSETFTVYVQPGTLAKGQRIALDAPSTSPTRCAQCHGEDLRGLTVIKAGQPGQPAPAIAGRSPFYMLRQLAGFRTRTRNGTTSTPMQAVAAALSLDDMIAAVAYAGSRTP
jgi:cytochrome c553